MITSDNIKKQALITNEKFIMTTTEVQNAKCVQNSW